MKLCYLKKWAAFCVAVTLITCSGQACPAGGGSTGVALTGEWTGTLGGDISSSATTVFSFPAPSSSTNMTTIFNSTDISMTFNAGGLPANLPANLPLSTVFVGSGILYFPPTKFNIGDTESKTTFTQTNSGGVGPLSTTTSTATFVVTDSTNAPDHFFVAYDINGTTTTTSLGTSTTYTTTGTLSFDALVSGDSMAVTVMFATNTSSTGVSNGTAATNSSSTMHGTLVRG